MRTCEICGGPLVPLGILGRLMWWTCRNCGMQYSTDAEACEDEREDLDEGEEYATL